MPTVTEYLFQHESIERKKKHDFFPCREINYCEIKMNHPVIKVGKKVNVFLDIKFNAELGWNRSLLATVIQC